MSENYHFEKHSSKVKPTTILSISNTPIEHIPLKQLISKKHIPLIQDKPTGKNLLENQPIEDNHLSYLDGIHIGTNLGNTLLDITKAYVVNTNYNKIQAAISITKTASLFMGNSELFTLSSSADVFANFYWDKSPKESLTAIALAFKGAIGVATIALYFSPYDEIFKLLVVSSSAINLAYKTYEMTNLFTPIKVITHKEEDNVQFKRDLYFLEFKNIGKILTQENCSNRIFTSKNELAKNPFFMEYMAENCEIGDHNIICEENNYTLNIKIIGDYFFND